MNYANTDMFVFWAVKDKLLATPLLSWYPMSNSLCLAQMLLLISFVLGLSILGSCIGGCR